MIRDFDIKDKEIFISMCEKFYSSNAVAHRIDSRHFVTTFNAAINKSQYMRGLIIEHEDIPVGYAVLAFYYSSEVGGMVVQIEELYIDDNYRGRGLGHKIFSFLDNEYPTAKRFRLEVSKENVKAMELYNKIGFKNLDYLQLVKDL